MLKTLRPMLTIAWKDTFLTFTDRTQLIIMIATPVILSLIIALAFSGFSNGGVSFQDIPVAIVNQDEGVTSITGGAVMNYGQIITNIMAPEFATEDNALLASDTCTTDAVVTNNTPPEDNITLESLFSPVIYTDVADAQAAVDRGDVSAAIIIPADFSATLDPEALRGTSDDLTGTSITLYANEANPVQVGIIRSVLISITQQITTGNVAIASTIDALIDRAESSSTFGISLGLASMLGEFNNEFSCAFTDAYHSLSITQVPLDEGQDYSTFVQVLVTFGSAQAVFFALFTTAYGAMSVYTEQAQGTLQRLVVAPIPRIAIIAGKLLGTILKALLQMILLLITLNVFAIVIDGTFAFIWGDNPLLLLVLTLTVALSVSGIGVFLVGVSSSQEQASTLASVVNVGLAAIGGAFAFQLPQVIAGFSPIYWAQDAYLSLFAGEPDITLNLLVLLVQGALMFIIGAWLFNRRTQF